MGGLGTIALNAPVAIGAYRLARHGLRLPAGLTRTLGASVLAWAWITLGVTAFGAAGWLRFGPLLGWSLVALAAGEAMRMRWPAPSERSVEAEGGGSWAGVAALGLILVPGVALGCSSLMGPVKVVSDGPIYHLYFAVRWWKAGGLERVPVPFGENAATYFPAVGDLWFTWLIVGWNGDRLARIGQAPFLALAAAASYGLARRLGANRDGAALAVAWFVTSTPLILFTFEPNVDTIFVGGYLAACFFLARAVAGQQVRASLLVGALAAGGAWGTKPTGTVFVPPLLVLAGLTTVRHARSGRAAARDLAVLAGAALLLPGYWFARNAAMTGNPLYPLDLPVLGWLGWYGPEVMRGGPYALPRDDLAALADIVLAVLDPRLAPFWLASLLGAWWVLPGARKAGAAGTWAAAGLAMLNGALYWILIPYRTQQRFFLQALGLAAVPLARFLGRAWLLRVAGVVLLAAHLFTSQGWPVVGPGRSPPWDFSPTIPNAVPPPLPAGPGGLAYGALTLACVAVVAGFRASQRPRRWGLAGVAAIGLVATAAGWTWMSWPPRWNTPAGRFYPLFPDFYRGWLALEHASGPGGSRVAYAGTNVPYYLFGTGLRNEVVYVNVDAHRDWLLHDYHRAAAAGGSPHWPDYPRPGWDRARPDFNAWLANLEAAGVDLLVVTRVNPAEGPHNVADPEGFPIEHRWAESHPERFQALYGGETDDPWFRLYRLISKKNEKGERIAP